MRTFKLLRSHPADAACNMSLDEKIFTRCLQDGIPIFRVYRWQAPSFTYGISQLPENEIDIKRCAADGIGIAKRMTGGGILFHNDEITYSFACSKQDVGEPQGTLVSYRQICTFLVRFYESLGLKASFAVESDNFKDRSAPHELCSASFEKYDILINSKKIGGNAQKRKRNFIFQHGSVPCSIDWSFVRRYIKNLPKDISSGVTALSGELVVTPDKGILEDKLIESFSRTFGVSFIEEKEFSYEAGMVR